MMMVRGVRPAQFGKFHLPRTILSLKQKCLILLYSSLNSHGQPNYSSPQIGAGPMNYGISSARAPSGTRAYSFDETMLPPAALEAQDLGNPAYSPYSASQSPSGGSLFNQSSWGYAAGAPDMYNPPGSPLHPRPTNHMPMYPNMMPGGMGGSPPPGGMRGAPMYGGQYFPASSPGPPIQTTSSNKGPDGANLFIFHIPNHFTNVDMYQLFSPFGNLLSVRIMVEKDTGRSRGFGFVSYDSPESAALAIKELNGFPVSFNSCKVYVVWTLNHSYVFRIQTDWQ
jgi:hypothetical protein